VWHGSHLCLYLFARNKRGDLVIGSTTETFGGAGGARWFADGMDIGGEIPNPISRIANVETNEAMYPIRYLFRRRMRDSGGAGRYRGGTGGEYATVPHGTADGQFGFVVSGKGVDFPMGHGLAGGYSGSPGRYVIARGALAAGAGADGGEPLNMDQIGGRHEVVSWGVYSVREGDVFYVRWNGAGGLGDPIERDPAAVARDLSEGVISREGANGLYGVVLDGEGRVEAPKTDARRKGIRKARLAAGQAVPASARAGAAKLDQDCPHCGQKQGIDGPLVHEHPMHELGPLYTTGALALARETVCRGCGTVMDFQVAKRGDDMIFDEVGTA
jgi:N-methylhydantoinase B